MSGRQNSSCKGLDTVQIRDDNTNRDHEDDAYDISLISWFRVIQKMPVDMKYRQSYGSNST